MHIVHKSALRSIFLLQMRTGHGIMQLLANTILSKALLRGWMSPVLKQRDGQKHDGGTVAGAYNGQAAYQTAKV